MYSQNTNSKSSRISPKKAWHIKVSKFSHFCFSVTQSCLTLCEPMDCTHMDCRKHRLPCPSPSPGVCSSSCPLSQWCHRTTSSSVALFSYPQTSPASGFFPTSRFFTSDGQSIGASASVLPMNIQDWFPLECDRLISLQSKGLSREFSPTPQFKSINSSALSLLLQSNSHIHTWLLEKP